MEIELPDGTVLDAPDNADVKSVVRGYRLAKIKAGNPGEYDPESQEFKDKNNPTNGMSTLAKLGAGFDSGLVRGARGATSLLTKAMNRLYNPTGPDVLETPDFASDETIKEQDKLDKPLSETGAGFTGQLGGQVAATLPLALASGGSTGAATGAGLLARALASAPARAAVEGAASSAMYADPDEQGKASGEGAMLGSALSTLAGGGGRLVRGLVKKSQAAQDLEHLAAQNGEEIEIPLSQAASEDDTTSRLVKTLYKEGLPYVPGATGKLNKQAEQSMNQFRGMALAEGAPDSLRLAEDAGAQPLIARDSMKESFDKGYEDTVKGSVFQIPSDFKARVTQNIKSEVPDVDKVTLKKAVRIADYYIRRFSDDARPDLLTGGTLPPVMSGNNILNVKNALSEVIKSAPNHEKGAYVAAQGEVQKVIDRILENRNTKEAYDALSEPYRNFTVLNAAIRKAAAKGGKFTPAQLATSAARKNNRQLMDMGSLGNEVLGSAVAKPSTAGRLLTYVGIGGLGVGAGPIAALGAVLGGNAMATKTVQRALLGDTAAQKILKNLAAKNPEMSRAIEASLRNAATTEVGANSGPSK